MFSREFRDPSTTGFFDYDRTSSGSSYHERMVRRRTRARSIVAVAVVLAVVMALACAFLALRH